MRSSLLALVIGASFCVIPHPVPASTTVLPDWSRRFGDLNSDTGSSVAVDGAGNVLLAGRFDLTVDMGGGVLTSAGGHDIVLAKFDAAGNHLWSQRFGDANHQYPYDIAVDGAGNVLLTGRFEGSVDFGGGPLTTSGVGDYDIFVAKFDPSGAHLWSQRFGDASAQLGNCIASDGTGQVIVAGEFEGSVTFGGQNFGRGIGAKGLFLVKFDPAGTHVWSFAEGNELDNVIEDLVVDADDNILLTGSFTGSLGFSPNPMLTSAGWVDIFVVKLHPLGFALWSRGFGDVGYDSGQAVTVDAAGDVLVTGGFNGSVDFGGGVLTAGGEDAFVAKFSGSLGDHIWSRRFGDADDQRGTGIVTDGASNVLTAGLLAGSADFGGGVLTSAGSNDIFVAGFDASGAHLWSWRYGDAAFQYAGALAGDGAGSCVLIGHFQGTLDFGMSPLTSAGSNDIYLARLAPAEATIQAVDDVPGDQGGWVRVNFRRALNDRVQATSVPILNYHVFRRVDNPALIAQVAAEGSAGAPAGHPADAAGDGPSIRFDGRSFRQAATTAPDATTTALWEAVATVPARQEAEYIALVPTLADSGAILQYSVYFVMAQTTVPSIFYDSAPDSGYSVDNLAPAPPEGLQFAGGILSWHESRDADFNYFTVYGSDMETWDETATSLGATSGTSADVSAQPYPYYHVTATDFAGNEGGATSVGGQISGVENPLAPQDFLRANMPNPFSSSTTIVFSLSKGAQVELSVYDLSGRIVRRLLSANVPAGVHQATWDGRDARGRPVAAGVYLYRLQSPALSRTMRMVLLR